MMKMDQAGCLSRRGFLASVATVGLTTGVADAGSGVDENLSVFFSDIHVSGEHVKGQPTYQNKLLDRAINQVLAMRPLPRRVVVFGDVALWRGLPADYEVGVRMLRRLEDVGIEVIVTTGNHDRRKPMFEAFPRQRVMTPVPDRFVSVVDLGSCDLYLLDSLLEAEDPKAPWNPPGGMIDTAQFKWATKAAKESKRPFLVGAHHLPHELRFCNTELLAALEDNVHFCGYIHGHMHKWYANWYRSGYSKRHVVRVAGLPTTGWWGSIGFTTLRTFADRAELRMAPGNDFFFPKPLEPGERRPIEWDDLVEEECGGRCIFRYGR